MKNQFKKRFFDELSTIYSVSELLRIWDILLMEYSFEKEERMVLRNTKLNIPDKFLSDVINRLKKKEPIDYIIGYKPFLDLDILVDSSVLIPRPETEEWVYNMIEELKYNDFDQGKLLEIGTGSGCICLSLKRHLPHLEIDSVDISNQAIITAEKNAELNELSINFFQLDFLEEIERKPISNSYNVIVSNPPYIARSEVHVMDEHVMDFEPHAALFAKNEDPLIFYRRISDFANHYLSVNGCLYIECNALRAEEIKSIFNENFHVYLFDDLQGMPRLLKAVKKN